MAKDTSGEDLKNGAPATTPSPDGGGADGKQFDAAAAKVAEEEHQRKIQGLKDEEERVEAKIAELRETRRKEAEAVVQKPTAEAKTETVVTDKQPETFDEWLGVMDKRADAKASQRASDAIKPITDDLAQLKNSVRGKALRAFQEKHPDYKDVKPGDERMKTLLTTLARVKSRGEMDADDILSDLEDSWAVLHRDDLLKKEASLREQRAQTDDDVSQIAATAGGGGSDRGESETIVLSESDRRSYAEARRYRPDLSVKQFVALSKRL